MAKSRVRALQYPRASIDGKITEREETDFGGDTGKCVSKPANKCGEKRKSAFLEL